MTIIIHGRLRDTLSFISPFRERKRRFGKAAARPLGPAPMNLLAGRLHPGLMALRVESRRERAESVTTYRLIPAEAGTRIPPFRAGQHVAPRFQIGGSWVSRPFSISSTPDEALDGNYYDLTVKLKPDGLCTPFMSERWTPGTELLCSGPSGDFCHEPLRDGARAVCLAGGTGITPFRSIIADSLAHDATSFTLLYGVSRPGDALFVADLEDLASRYPGRLDVVKVCVEPDSGWGGERGFLSSELLRSVVPVPADATWLISGPDAMKRYLERQMEGWGLRPGQVRREGSAEAVDPSSLKGYPGGVREGPFSIEVRIGHQSATVTADPRETVLVALERAGLDPPSLCRSGECGWCRARLVRGHFHASTEGNRVRAAETKFGYFHPCRSWPLSDMAIEVPANPRREEEDAE